MHVKKHVTGRILVSFAMQDTNTKAEPALQNSRICCAVHAAKSAFKMKRKGSACQRKRLLGAAAAEPLLWSMLQDVKCLRGSTACGLLAGALAAPQQPSSTKAAPRILLARMLQGECNDQKAIMRQPQHSKTPHTMFSGVVFCTL
jgi:hypothetical protein